MPACGWLSANWKEGKNASNDNYYYYYHTSAFWLAKSPLACFENSRDFVDKHDHSIICYPIG